MQYRFFKDVRLLATKAIIIIHDEYQKNQQQTSYHQKQTSKNTQKHRNTVGNGRSCKQRDYIVIHLKPRNKNCIRCCTKFSTILLTFVLLKSLLFFLQQWCKKEMAGTEKYMFIMSQHNLWLQYVLIQTNELILIG